MARIVVSENVTLDGVVQDPTGEEGFTHGGWFTKVTDNDRVAWAAITLDEHRGADALLFGRRTYEFFAARWPSRTGELADGLNSIAKYVVSSTLHDAGWNNTTVMAGDVVTEVSNLKQRFTGNIVVYASGELVRALMAHELVDELRLMVYPTVLGTGNRLFGEACNNKALRLLDTRTVGDSLALLTYEFVRAA
jgi:dihydrofolate reductase